MVMAPRSGPFERFQGSAIVALSGDRAPFATGNKKTIGPIGYKVALVSVDNQRVEDFIRNTDGRPSHLLPGKKKVTHDALERPADVKLSPDGRTLYVLDMGRMENKGGKEHVYAGTGQVFRLVLAESPEAAGANAAQSAGDSESDPEEPPAQ
jgi:hypothetical protein